MATPKVEPRNTVPRSRKQIIEETPAAEDPLPELIDIVQALVTAIRDGSCTAYGGVRGADAVRALHNAERALEDAND